MNLRLKIHQTKDKIILMTSSPWISYVWLVLITLLAAILRFYKLGTWGFWIDEIFTVNHARFHFSNLELLFKHIPPFGNWVPVSVILTAQAVNMFGVSELTARLGPAIIGILSIPLLYFPAKKLFGNQATLIALLLLAVAPWHIEWSQNARFYTALMLFYTLALFYFYFGIEQDRPLYILFYMILLYLAASERLFAVMLIPVIVGYLFSLKIFSFEKPPGFKVKNVMLTLSPVIVACIIEIGNFVVNDTSRFFGDFDWFFLYRLNDPFRLLSFIGFEIGVPLMCFSIFSSIYLFIKKSRVGLMLLISAIVPVALLLALNPFIFTKTRYIFMTLPSWIILSAIGFVEILSEIKMRRKILALGILFVFLSDFGASNLLYYQVNNGNRHDWKGAFSLVNQQRLVGDEVVTSWPQWEGFYWDKDIVIWEKLDSEFVVNSGVRYWFILDEEIVWGNMEMKNWIEQNAKLVDVLYLRRQDEHYLKVYLFDPDQ